MTCVTKRGLLSAIVVQNAPHIFAVLLHFLVFISDHVFRKIAYHAHRLCCILLLISDAAQTAKLSIFTQQIFKRKQRYFKIIITKQEAIGNGEEIRSYGRSYLL